MIERIAYKAMAGDIHPGEELLEVPVSLSGADALRHDGLWPGGHTSRLWKLTTDVESVEKHGERALASMWRVVEAIDVKPSLREVSDVFVDFEDEMLEEQLLWRRALERPRQDAELVETLLEQAVEARGLKYWSLKRLSERELRRTPIHARSMYTWSAHAALKAWQAWDVESRDDEAYDVARRAAWTLWYHPTPWDAFDVADQEPGWDDVSPECWDAWVSLSVYYTASCGFIELPAEAFTAGIRTAYHHGLALIRPIEQGVLGWAMT